MLKKTDDMTFGERLVYARNKKGLNQTQLAKLIGVRPNIISRWENGKQKPYMSAKIQILIKALEVSEDWLLGNDKFRMSQQDIRLTKEQQQFVADNEGLINYMYTKKFRFLKAPYDFYYGYAAIGLCKAAIAYDANKGSFFALAYLCIKSEITHAYESANKDIWTRLSLNDLVYENDTSELESKIPAPDEWEKIEYKILAESVYQRVELVLTPKEKVAFKRWLHGENKFEIARAMGGISINTVSDHVINAKNKCRELINPDELFA